MKRKYYPNNWKDIQKCPDNYFPSLEYWELVDWKIHGYELPSSYYGIIRVYDLETGKVSEHSYKSEYHALNKLKSARSHKTKAVLATMEGVWNLKQIPLNPPIDFNNP